MENIEITPERTREEQWNDALNNLCKLAQSTVATAINDAEKILLLNPHSLYTLIDYLPLFIKGQIDHQLRELHYQQTGE